MGADEGREPECHGLALGIARVRRHREGPVVAQNAIDRDRDVQQHAVDAVLVDEITLAVEHFDEVGLEQPEVF